MATVVIHVLTFLGLRIPNGAQSAVLLILVTAAFLAFGAMVFNLMVNQPFPGESGFPPDLISDPWTICLMILLIYAAVNLLVCLQLMESGSPERTVSGYILSDHGKIIRPLTEGEYWKMRAYELRLFTGHMLMFLGWPMVYFFRRSVREPGPERA